jgi:acyl-[acyl-carrier-protein]-phospholipid O-acyltransferase/long-chain-fatty-acid--[acyl-carrier-protein] ligase
MAAVTIAFSRHIRNHNAEPHVGLLLPTSSAGAITNMAALLCGKSVVNLNFTVSSESLAAAADKAGLTCMYTSRKFVQMLEKKGMDIQALIERLTVYYLEDIKEELNRGTLLTNFLLVKFLPLWAVRGLFCTSVALDSPAAILFSSGSEGEPKGVILSHRNIMANLKQISEVLNAEGSDVVMASLPLFHAFGLTVTTFMPLVEGIPIVCHPDPTDSVNIAKAVVKYRATILCGTSTFLRLYTKNTKVHSLMFESLRIVVAGAEKLNPDVKKAFKLKFNTDVFEGYGATETTPVASVNIPDQLDSSHWRVQLGSKEGTVGMPLPGTSFRIVDPESLQELAINEDGLILIGGAQVMLGYLGDPEKTREVIIEIDGKRWYKSGDKGHLDQDGFLIVVDRYSRFAKIGGEMISLTAVEENIRKVIGDTEMELVAVNIPDEKKGERIVLLLSDDIDEDNIRKMLIESESSPLMIPAQILTSQKIPVLGSGKTDFRQARKMVMDNL